MTSRTANVRTARPSHPGGTHADALDALGTIGAAAYKWDIGSDALAWTPGTAELLGLPALSDISTGNRFARFVDPSGPPGREEAVLRATPEAGTAYEATYRFQPPSAGKAAPRWIEDRGRWFPGKDGRPVRAVGLIRVVDDRRGREETLLYRSDHDALTGTLNRPRLVEELDDALAEAQRAKACCALAIVAIDNLGPINDAYGYTAGDELVAGVAGRIAATMRRGDALGRLAGNKVGVVLRGCSDTDVRIAAERFSAAVGEAPVETSVGAVAVTVSIGTVILPRHARTGAEAMARAQEALAAARARGVACILAYEPSARRESDRRANVAMAAEVVAALNGGRVGLALQPVVAVASGNILFHEALCRLQTADGEEISPGAFIETAERLGVIRLIDHRMLDLAVAAMRDDPRLTLSVNLSASSALYGSWFSQLTAHLRRARKLAPRLVIEITETVAIADLDRAIAFVSGVRDLGCRVAIDDFGAGHTSFRNLRVLGVDFVKIDGAFIEGIADSPDDRVFVSTLVRLARHMGLTTIAERVVSEADAAILREIGVDGLQGHLVGEAVPYAPLERNGRTGTTAGA